MLLAIVAGVALYIFALPRLLGSLVGLAFPAKLVVSGALLVPLGWLMGMPFPTGLRALAAGVDAPLDIPAPASSGSAIEWAWAMNAASSVLGSVLAIVVAIHFGLRVALACAAGAYLLAMLLSLGWPAHTDAQRRI